MSSVMAKTDRSGGLWLTQVVTGVLLIVVLGLHLVAHHFIVEGGLRDYDDIIAYLANPIVVALEVIFLVTVALHSMLGLRAIALDLNPGEATKRRINIVLAAVGTSMVLYGLWLTFTLTGRAV